MHNDDDRGNILVVDDTPDNLRLLSAMLSEKGYTVRKALNGQTALNTVQTLPPDLILLDINLPGINGYEVCQELKNEPKTQEIPIIFISALDDALDKVKAFKVGGTDYISKPFQAEEVIVRVENQLTICRQKKQLQQEIRDRQKAEEALRVYLHAVSHDLRNPIIGMSMILGHFLKQKPDENNTIPVPITILKQMVNSCDRQNKLINSLVETQQYDIWGVPLQCKPFSLHQLIQELTAEWELRLKQHQVTLIENVSPIPLVNGDQYQLWRVFENLLANALKYNPPGIKITISTEVTVNQNLLFVSPIMVRCTIADNGIGMDEAQIKNLFERYQRGEKVSNTIGLGLGLYLCRQIIQAHGGEIGVITHPNEGCKFWFTLPVASEQLQ